MLQQPPTLLTMSQVFWNYDMQPLSDDAREKTATAFSEALKAVVVSMIKLAAFHALFTWLTYRYTRHEHR
jgi:hypothetical protein